MLLRLVDRFSGELQCSKVHADALLRAEIAMRTNSLGRVHVDWTHEPSRFVSADPEHGNVRRTEPRFDIGKMRRVSAVAAEINAPALKLDDVAAPQALLPIEKPAG